MAENGHSRLIHYHSLFRHGVDEKRRVQIPAKWRPDDFDGEFTVILWPNGAEPDAFLLVLPPAEMDALGAKIRAMPMSDPNAAALRRLLGKKSASVGLDKVGRMCIPEEMAKTVGLKDEAVLIGMVDRFAIWDPKRYEQVSAVDAALLPEAFKLI